MGFLAGIRPWGLAGGSLTFILLKMCAHDRRNVQDVITPYFPYILIYVLREIVLVNTYKRYIQHLVLV